MVLTTLRSVATVAVVQPVRLFLHRYKRWYDAAPLTVAFVTCYIKGSAADFLAQYSLSPHHFVEPDDEEGEREFVFDWRRNVAFGLFSGWYCGPWQHTLYNVVYTRIFGAGLNLTRKAQLIVALKKVAVDNIIHVPFGYLPVYYMFKNIVLGERPLDGLVQYKNEFTDLYPPYLAIWTPAQLVTFMALPPQFRVGWVGAVSLVWMVIMSAISNRERAAELAAQRAAAAAKSVTISIGNTAAATAAPAAAPSVVNAVALVNTSGSGSSSKRCDAPHSNQCCSDASEI